MFILGHFMGVHVASLARGRQIWGVAIEQGARSIFTGDQVEGIATFHCDAAKASVNSREAFHEHERTRPSRGCSPQHESVTACSAPAHRPESAKSPRHCMAGNRQ